MIGIYKIEAPDGKIYIGQSINLKVRFRDYKATNNCKNQKKLWQSFQLFGVEAHSFEIIEYCAENELNDKERFWQDHYDVCGANGLNCLLTTGNQKKRTYTIETRKKMSENRTGDKNHMFGKRGKLHHGFGSKQSEETKAKYQNRKGVPKSDIHKARIGQQQKGGNNHQAKLVLDLQTGIFYDCVKDAALAKMINPCTLYDNVNQRRGIKNKYSIILV